MLGRGRRCRVLVWWVVLAFGEVATAHADGSPYCEKVKARAASDAAVLMWPSAVVEGMHIPVGGALDVGATTESSYQLRAGVAFSPLGLYRGTRLMELGRADCARHSASQEVATILAHGASRARLAALRREEQYLRARRDEWSALSAKAEQRLNAGAITLADYDAFRRHAATLEHKLVGVSGEIAQLAASESKAPLGALPKSVRKWMDADAKYERQASHVRKLDAWQVQLMGGITPQSHTDWYGVVELSFNAGAFVQHRQEKLYLEARAAETKQAEYELRERARVFAAQLRAAKTHAEQDRAVIAKELAFLSRARAALGGSNAKNVLHARDGLTLQQISLEADQVFLGAFAAAVMQLLEDQYER